MHRALCAAALAGGGLLFAACGSASSANDSVSSATSSAASAAVAASPTAASSTPVSTSKGVASSAASAPSSSVATRTAGPAPAGAAIKAGASTTFPDQVGAWKQQRGAASGPATVYSSNGALVSVSFLKGSQYDSIVKNITRTKTKAGTGYCGSDSDPTNLTCYLKAADGVVNVSADGSDVPLAQVVPFTNELTSALGTS